MANHASHGALPFPVKNARYTVEAIYLDADGDPLDPTTPDSEISKDNGAYADCAEEVTLATGARGGGMLTLSGAETDCAIAKLWLGSANAKATKYTLAPRVLPVLFSGTAQAGAAGSLTLATDVPAIANLLIGCILKTTGGTGGGGTGGANNQARVITAYTTGRVASVVPNWETTPDATTTYEVLLTEMAYAALANLVLLNGSAPNNLIAGRLDANAQVVADKTGYALTTAEEDAIVDKVFDEQRAAHVADGTFGQSLQVVRTGTAQAGAAGTITLDASASATDDLYNDEVVDILSGTGAGQARRISDYVGSSKVASVVPNWATNPDGTSVFRIRHAARADLHLWQGVAPTALAGGRVDADLGAWRGTVPSTLNNNLVQVDVQRWLNAVVNALLSGRVDVDIRAVQGNTDAPVRIDRAARAIVAGTVTTGATTTSIPTSSLVPAAGVTDQFKGRIVVFDMNTTTVNLRGQATDITGSTSGGTLTVTALTTAPVSGDTFVIV